MSSSFGSEVIGRVQQALEAFAAAKKTPTFSDIEASVGIKFRRDQWHEVLDPIHAECLAAGGPDLTAIIVFGSGENRGYPAYFSDGAKARSRRFNAKNPDQLARWAEEVKRVFKKYGQR